MKPEFEFYNIVVVGAMNPAIHSAGWYRLVGVISEAEFNEAVNSKSTFCVPPMAHLELAALKISCQEQRWEVQTTRADQTKRLCDITGKVFDDLLTHTPVSALGFNFNFGFNVGRDAGKAIALELKQSRLSIDWPSASAEYTVTADKGPYIEKTNISPRGESVVVVNNYHYDIKGEAPKQSFFDLRKMIDESYASHRARALEVSIAYAERIVKG
jgi:hypothetical protein